MSDKFAASKKNGPHALLARMAGKWRGVCKTWFEPGKLGDTQPITGEIKLALDGRFLIHTYRSKLVGHKMLGHALIGFDLYRQKFIVSWADSCHNGTTIMNSVQDRKADKNSFSVLGSYPDGQGGPDWGWRTIFTLSGKDALIIKHVNLTPKGEESGGVEVRYGRA